MATVGMTTGVRVGVDVAFGSCDAPSVGVAGPGELPSTVLVATDRTVGGDVAVDVAVGLVATAIGVSAGFTAPPSVIGGTSTSPLPSSLIEVL